VGDPRPDAAVIAVDVGGTSIKAGILTEQGPVAFHRVATDAAAGADGVVDRIVATVLASDQEATRRGVSIAGAGVVVPGIVDEAAGVARRAVNLGWRDVDLRARLAARLSCPVAVGHDVRAGALAEARWGAAVGCATVLFVPIGTGIAAAFVVDDDVFPGAAYQAGEIGQIQVGGATLEAFASGLSIANRYRAASGAGPAVTAPEVVERAGRGDEVAAAVWQSALTSLADVLAGAIAMVDPEITVVGGGVARAGEALLGPLRAELATRLPWRSPPTVAAARFGDAAGWVGAALLARAAAGIESDVTAAAGARALADLVADSVAQGCLG
jgi:glucokinase